MMDRSNLALALVLVLRARPMEEAVNGVPLEVLRREAEDSSATLSELFDAADRLEELGLAAQGIAQVGSAEVRTLRLTADHIYMTDAHVRMKLLPNAS
jgi:hypothetical protein